MHLAWEVSKSKLLLTTFCLLLAQSLWAVDIRVRFLSDQSSIQVTAHDFKIQSDSHKCKNPQVKIKALHAQMIVQYKEKQKTWQLYNTDTKQVCEIESEKLKFQAKSLIINHHLVPNQISFEPSKQKFNVVASLDIEKYLVGVLSKEMPASFPLEAFKAQAIASRSYAMKKILSSKEKDYDVEAGTLDQVFEYSNGDQKIRAAVEQTKNMVLENQSGRLFSVYFHADCGGHTEEASNVWGEGEKLGTTKDDGCPFESHSSWNYSISKYELTARLRVILQLGEAKITSIEEFENTSSGRKKSLKFLLDDRTTRIITGQQLRNILGFEKLKSTLFAFNQKGADFVFEGRGHGHGVGMCQWGARHLALGGEVYPSILKHYFPRAKLAQISGAWAKL